MGEQADCKHESFGYFPAINEAGWKCLDGDHLLPGEPDGYRPDLDRSHIADKVYGMMNDLHQHNFIYVGNSEAGDHVTREVVQRCQQFGFYDQISIIASILEVAEGTHPRFWKGIGDGIMSGNDPRERCHCGKLAKCYSSRGNFCLEHSQF